MSKTGKRGLTGKHNIGRKGPDCNAWQGGCYTDGYGYIQVWVGNNHPMANTKGYVPEHRLVMVNQLDRYITKDEIVHHKNGNKTDNRPENLEIIDRATHQRIHRTKVKPVTCAGCGIVFTPNRPPRCKRSFHSRDCWRKLG